MPIPQRARNPLAPPEPPDFKEVEVAVRCFDVVFVGGLPRSFRLEEADTIEWGNTNVVLTIAGAEISLFLANVLSIDEYPGTIKRRVKIDHIADYKASSK